MRRRTLIPQGDLFTVLEASSPDHIQHAMKEILEIESEASKQVSTKEGLIELLSLLRERSCPVALVTRNTKAATKAFFNLIGPEWSSLFSPVLTREYHYVKPDPRLLMDVAKEWGLSPSRLLMVGDSFEDVEVGNAAGYASCLIAGGGNEKPGAVVQTPAGAAATFKVDGLPQLKTMLETGSGLEYGWPERKVEVLGEAGRPSPGLDFLDWCESQGSILKARASFPRMGKYAGGLATSEERGSKVLHLACGAGGLTKLMCSQGIRALGADVDIEAAERRGLSAVKLVSVGFDHGSSSAIELVPGSLGLAHKRGPFDAVMIQGPDADNNPHVVKWWSEESLHEILSVLSHNGSICGEVAVSEGMNPASIFNSLHQAGCLVTGWSMPSIANGKVLRIIAKRIH